MSDRSRILIAVSVGAAIGGTWAWIYYSEDGRQIRKRVGPAIDRLIDEVGRAWAIGQQAKAAVNDGKQLVTDVTASIRELAS